MKKLLKKGKALVAYVSAFAILAVSMLSVLTGVNLSALALETPVIDQWNGEFDTELSGGGLETDPYLITSAEELAAVCYGQAAGSTTGAYFKVDGIDEFYMDSVTSPSTVKGWASANDVKDYYGAVQTAPIIWQPNATVKLKFDGNGAYIYGLYMKEVRKAGLFAAVNIDSVIKNVAVKNSYIYNSTSFNGADDYCGLICGLTSWSEGNVTIENCIVANNFVYSVGGMSGEIIGHGAKTTTVINNCLVTDNVLYYNANIQPLPYQFLVRYADVNTITVSNTIGIDVVPRARDKGTISNSYYFGTVDRNETDIVSGITEISSLDNMKGAAAKTNLAGLDAAIWFFNETTYPQPRTMHNLKSTDNGNGTHRTLCAFCGIGADEEHKINSEDACTECNYQPSCTNGHTLQPVAEVPATETTNGVKAHNYCLVCERKFIGETEVSDSDLVIPMLVSTSEYSGTPDTVLAGLGTEESPFLITSADEFAAVALGAVASKDESGNAYYFEVIDSLNALYINGGETVAAYTTSAEVKSYFTSGGSYKNWAYNGSGSDHFYGKFNGNGVTVYGIYSNENYFAGLFPKAGGGAVIENIAIKNSYISSQGMSGAIVGKGYINDSGENYTAGYSNYKLDINNTEVVNNVIINTGTSQNFGGVVTGYIQQDALNVTNCIIYGNEADFTNLDAEMSLFAHGGAKSGATTVHFTNIIALGHTFYGGSHWTRSADTGSYLNVYSDRANTLGSFDGFKSAYNLNQIDDITILQGANAVNTITGFSEEDWFFNTTTYPVLRASHTYIADADGSNGHKNIRTDCCGLVSVDTSVVAHTYDENDKCTLCGYEVSCKNGHTLEPKTEVPATKTTNGTKAHDYCSVCFKKFINDVEVSDADLVIPMLVSASEYTGTPDTTLEGSGAAADPFIIKTADEFAAVALGYVASKDASGNAYYFEVADDVEAFYINGGATVAAYTTSNDVKSYFTSGGSYHNWAYNGSGSNHFYGKFNGNGVTVYGLYSNGNFYSGLFPKAGGGAVIENIAIKNSYISSQGMSAAIVGKAYINDSGETYTAGYDNYVLNINNIEVVNNVIINTGTVQNYGGVVTAYVQLDALNVTNCIVYGNDADFTNLDAEMSLFAHGAAKSGATTVHVTNLIALGHTFYGASHWTRSADTGTYKNVYSDMANTMGNFSGSKTTYNLNQIDDVTTLQGVSAVNTITGFSEEDWFFNTTTYPVLRVFHTFTADADGGNGHTNVRTDCCGLVAIDTDVVDHIYNEDDKCTLCGYEVPCKEGHTLIPAAEIPATELSAGTAAHDYCTVCYKKFIDGVEVSDEQLVIPMISSPNIYSGTPDTALAGSGTKESPFLITSADEFASVALGAVASKDESGNAYYFEVIDSLNALYINGGEAVAAYTTSAEVKSYFTSGGSYKNWAYDGSGSDHFYGKFNGNGVTVYGIYSNTYYGGLFPKAGGGAVIENIAIKNSYINASGMSGALVGKAYINNEGESYNTGYSNYILDINNTEVVNNVIINTGTTQTFGGVVTGYIQQDALNVTNCIIYGNEADFANLDAEMSLFAHGGAKSGATTVHFTNIIALGHTFYGGSHWTRSADTGSYQNVYSDKANTLGSFDGFKSAYNLNQIDNIDDIKGANAANTITGFSEEDWFFNTTTYPVLRAFHTFTAEAQGVDGHINEKATCCELVSAKSGLVAHTYSTENKCTLCGYDYPCTNGHNFTIVPAKPASFEEAGNMEYKRCSQCLKNYLPGAADDEPVSSALSDADIIIPQLRSYDEWDGSYASYFWMNNDGDGSVDNPFIISTAEQLAAVANGNLKYDASKPTSIDFDVNKYTIKENSALETAGLYFKVSDIVTAFYLNGGVDIAEYTNATDVKAYFEENGGIDWVSYSAFSGHFDGNGVTIYGLYRSSSANAPVGLFTLTKGHSTIKNVALKNSYIKGAHAQGGTAAIVGATTYSDDNASTDSVGFENIVVANNYIACTATNEISGASALAGMFYDKDSATINNCLVYGNIIDNNGGTKPYRSGLITTYNGTIFEGCFKNIIALGVTPWSLTYKADGSFNHSGWYLSNVDSGNFMNVYTDQSKADLQTYNQSTNSDAMLKKSNINIVEAEKIMGAEAVDTITGFSQEDWFFNKTTYPELRVFHTFKADAKGVDGHKNEETTCCGLECAIKGTLPHMYGDGDKCTICGFDYPCTNGHNFTDVPAKPASFEEAGNIAYKSCSQCIKNYRTDATIDAPISAALSDADIIIPQKRSYDEWDGSYASYFWMNNVGDGSVANPFIISTAEQLAAVATADLRYDESKPVSDNFDISKYTIKENNVLDTDNLYFEIDSTVTAFYMNGGEQLAKETSSEKVKEYFEENGGNNWKTSGFFAGTFNGNGATVYGLYSVDNTAAGLFPQIDVVTIKNITVKNSYLVTAEGSHNSIAAGGIVGIAKWYNDAQADKYGTVTIRNCVVANSYICSQNADKDYGRVGAMVGNVYAHNLIIRDSLVYGNTLVNGSGIPGEYKAGLIASAAGVVTTVKNVLSIDTPPYTQGSSNWYLHDTSTFTNVYTDCDVTDYSTITQLTKKQMKGQRAIRNMPAFDWETLWMANDNDYPTPRVVNIKAYASGLAWTGEVAQEFPSGDGSKSNPYQISAPEYLALMLTSENNGLYYELVADIIINDTSAVNWQFSAKEWYTSANSKAFGGYLNGNGYTVSGIYYDGADAGESIGLIPIKDSGDVSNIKISNSYIAANSDVYAGALIGSVVDGAAKPIVLNGITIEDNVVFSGTSISGGIIGKAEKSVIRINNSISKSNGLVGIASNGVNIKNSISVNAVPVKIENSAVFKNVYTNVNTTLAGVTVLSDDAMKGEAAATNMVGFDFENIWAVVEDDYPAIVGIIDSSNGIEGEVWSGNVADAYAGGTGTEEDPYLIATGEQLARCITKHAQGKHYKLVADIYLNDIQSEFWDIKVGCNEWYHSKSGAAWALFKDGSFDGDGHVVYGVYFERTGITAAKQGVYLGLFATIGENSLIQNVAVSNAYIAGSVYSGKDFMDSSSGLVGSVVRWFETSPDKSILPSTSAAKKITSQPDCWDRMPIIKNCLVDHTCYIAGTYAGGIIGYGDDPYRVYDCIFTGSLEGVFPEHTGGIAGQDNANGAYYYRCVSLPQTCDRPYGGWSNANWRASEGQWPTTVEDSYYFSKYKPYNSSNKIANHKDAVGEAAMTTMPLLDWENTWMTIKDGTPIQQIFTKHRSLEKATELSDKDFKAPFVTVSFMTNTDECIIEDMVGRMYEEITLPSADKMTREGYNFTGWYVFDDCSIEYPLDTFPPRDLQLFAGWEPTGIIQNFENYADTIYDYNFDEWRLNKPGVKGGYKNAYVRNGAKSLRLLSNNTDFVDALLNYEDMLKIGQTYRISFWITTDTVNNPDTVLKLVHNVYPEYNKENKGVEEMLTVKGLTVGEWTQYFYEFTALTPWVSIRAGGNSSLYFDDVIVAAVGEDIGYDNLIKYLDQLDTTVVEKHEQVVKDPEKEQEKEPEKEQENVQDIVQDIVQDNAQDNAQNNEQQIESDNNVVSPSTSDAISAAALIAAILSCACIIIISRKNLIEVIDD